MSIYIPDTKVKEFPVEENDELFDLDIQISLVPHGEISSNIRNEIGSETCSTDNYPMSGCYSCISCVDITCLSCTGVGVC